MKILFWSFSLKQLALHSIENKTPSPHTFGCNFSSAFKAQSDNLIYVKCLFSLAVFICWLWHVSQLAVYADCLNCFGFWHCDACAIMSNLHNRTISLTALAEKTLKTGVQSGSFASGRRAKVQALWVMPPLT